jgi:hypothetical protein
LPEGRARRRSRHPRHTHVQFASFVQDGLMKRPDYRPLDGNEVRFRPGEGGFVQAGRSSEQPVPESSRPAPHRAQGPGDEGRTNP